MGLRAWLRRVLTVDEPGPRSELEPRHERRERAKLRHEQTDEPLWGAKDRHVRRWRWRIVPARGRRVRVIKETFLDEWEDD